MTLDDAHAPLGVIANIGSPIDHADVKPVEDWARLWTGQRFEDLADIFTDDLVCEDIARGALNEGRAELIAFCNATIVAFPDFTATLHSAVADDDRGAAEWTMSGTHVGDFPG